MNRDQLLIRDLRLDQQLEDISKKATPSREAPSEPPSYLSNSVVSDINRRDMGIEEQLQKISRNTIKDIYGWKPQQIKSDVTNEMIQEYQDELERSFYEDPVTGRKLKYVPVNTDFTLEEPNLAQTVDETIVKQQIERFTRFYKEVEDEIKLAYDAIAFIRSNEELVSSKMKLLGPYAAFDEIPEIKKLQAKIEELKGELVTIEAQIGVGQNFRAANQRNLLENQAEVDRVRKANRELLKQKSEELNLLNRGKLNLQQQPNESDEDFKQRLLDVGQVEFDETYVEDAAGRRALKRFKENMKEITRNNTLVEQMIKLVSPVRLFEFNKFFSLILKKFQEIYGRAKLTEDNAQELVDFFNNVLGKENLSTGIDDAAYRELTRGMRQAELSRQASREIEDIFGDLEAMAVTPERAVGGFDPRKKDESLDFIMGFDPSLYARKEVVSPFGLPALPIAEAEAEFPVAEFPEVGLPATIGRAESIGAAESVPFNPYQMTKAQLLQEFQAIHDKGVEKGKGKLLLSQFANGQQPNKSDILKRLMDRGIIGEADTYEITPRVKKVGRPIGSGFLEVLPKFAYFGKIAINPKALYYDNNLIVMNHKKHHLNGYNMVKVSDHFVNAIMKLLNQEVPKSEDLKHFDLKEKELYDIIIHLAGLHKRVEHNLDRTKQAMKHRFDLLDGEVNAGNTNHVIKKELKDLVHKMAFAGMISHHEAQLYLYPNMREKYNKKKASKSKK